MTLADEGDGFDLDDHATTSSSDPIGCGKVDGSGGADNVLSSLQESLSSFGVDLEAMFADGIASGDLVLDYAVSGYHGPDDAEVLLDVTSNGNLVATGVAGSVSGDVLSATIPEMPMTGASGTDFEITTRNVQIRLPMIGAPDAAEVSGGMLGGGLLWDEAGDHDLRSVVLANLPSFVSEDTAESMVQEDVLDLQPTGSTGDCDALSVALLVDASAP